MRTLLASLLFVTACAGTATYSASGTVYTPDLVEVEPGVQVIVDYDEPVFYSDNYYWRNNGGRWYRSSYHDRGWVAYEAPQRIRTIRQPDRYRRYRPANYQPRNNRAYRPAPSNREYRPAPSNNRPDYRPAPSDNRGRDKDRRDRDRRDDDDKRDRKDRRDRD